MRLRLLFLLFPAIMILSTAAWARSEEEHHYLGETTGTKVAAWAALPQTLGKSQLSEEQIRALTPVLRDKDKRGYKIESLLVFQQDGVPTYVVASWGNHHLDGKLTIDRITPQNGLERLITEEGAMYKIAEPSGQDVFPDHVPALFIDEASGGSGHEGYTQHLYRLDKEVVEVTPPLRTPWIEQREGELMAMSSDDRWGNYFLTCGQCGPLIPVISVWKDGAFHPDCRQHPALIRKMIAADLARAKKELAAGDEAPSPLYAADALLSVTLLHLQLGEVRQAKQTSGRLLTLVRSSPLLRDHDWENGLEEEAVKPFFAEVKRKSSRACPLFSSVGKGGHPGAEERANAFR